MIMLFPDDENHNTGTQEHANKKATEESVACSQTGRLVSV
jgi:hypothetical protein